MALFEESYKHEIQGKSVLVEYSGTTQLSDHNKDAARQMIVDAIVKGETHDTYTWNNFNQCLVWWIEL